MISPCSFVILRHSKTSLTKGQYERL